MIDVVALGELLIDFTSQSIDADGYPTMAAHPGGAPANFLAALAKFGAKTAMIGKVGDDAFGEMLLHTLHSAQIDVSGMVVDSNVFTTLAFVTLAPDGDRTFSFARKPGADTQLSPEEINFSLIDAAQVFHFGTLSLTSEPSRTATYWAVSYAKSKGKCITYDPNFRIPLWDDLVEAKRQILWGLSQADVVKISEEEVEFLFQLDAAEGAKYILEHYGVQLVFVTCGANGCYFANRNGSGHVPGLPGIRAVDTTGAGDIFGGSAVWKLLQIGKMPGELTESEMADVAGFACAVAGLSTTKHGGISSIPEYGDVIDLC